MRSTADQQLNKKFFSVFGQIRNSKKRKYFCHGFVTVSTDEKKGLQHIRKPLIFIE